MFLKLISPKSTNILKWKKTIILFSSNKDFKFTTRQIPYSLFWNIKLTTLNVQKDTPLLLWIYTILFNNMLSFQSLTISLTISYRSFFYSTIWKMGEVLCLFKPKYSTIKNKWHCFNNTLQNLMRILKWMVFRQRKCCFNNKIKHYLSYFYTNKDAEFNIWQLHFYLFSEKHITILIEQK